jgi:hypothetical protein
MGGHIINTRRAVSIVLTLLQSVRLTGLVEYLLPNDEVSLKKGRLSTLTMFIRNQAEMDRLGKTGFLSKGSLNC